MTNHLSYPAQSKRQPLQGAAACAVSPSRETRVVNQPERITWVDRRAGAGTGSDGSTP